MIPKKKSFWKSLSKSYKIWKQLLISSTIKKEIKTYGRRLYSWPKIRPLEMLKILAKKIGLKKKLQSNLKEETKRAKNAPHDVFYWKSIWQMNKHLCGSQFYFEIYHGKLSKINKRREKLKQRENQKKNQKSKNLVKPYFMNH